jgi:hypothetical protein
MNMVIISGDFNLPIKPSSPYTPFEDELCAYNLKQHVDTATHIGGSILDLLITSSSATSLSSISVNDGISDHCSVTFILKKGTTELKNPTRVLRRRLTENSLDNIQRRIVRSLERRWRASHSHINENLV